MSFFSEKNTQNDQISDTLFRVLMTAVKLILLGVCITLLYALLGDSLDLNFNQSHTKQAIKSTNTPKMESDDWDKVENGIHLSTGLIYAENFDIIRANCTACHSGKLVAQNRATRDGWLQMIRWMQATQGLWDLGINEPKILDYLATHYAPEAVGRRANIDIAAVEWYILNLDE